MGPEDMQMNVDPGAPPPDPMLAGGLAGVQYGDEVEVEKRERVEYELLCALEKVSKATEVQLDGEAARAFAAAAQSLALAYASVAGVEHKQEELEQAGLGVAQSLFAATQDQGA